MPAEASRRRATSFHPLSGHFHPRFSPRSCPGAPGDVGMSAPDAPGADSPSEAAADSVDAAYRRPDLKPEQVNELIENLERLEKQNSSLRERVRYLEDETAEERAPKRPETEDAAKTKVSKWTKMKGALGWEMKGGQESMDLLKVPGSCSDRSSSFSPSPAESVTLFTPLHASSSSSSEEDLVAVDAPDRPPEGEQEYCVSPEIDDKGNKSQDSTSPLLNSNKKVLKSAPKEHKTPWSKMKGIIIHNTRVVGVKKRHSQDDTDSRQEDKHQYEALADQMNGLDDVEGLEPLENCRLSLPTLTVTVASVEELSGRGKGPSSSSRNTDDDDSRQPTVKAQNSTELSPPIQRKSSKWFKVKNVFLPSGHIVRTSNSAPCSPVRSDSFVYEVESDEISSGEFIDEAQHKDRYDNVFHEDRAAPASERNRQNIHEEIQTSYHKLQRKLNEEFERKEKEWDKARSSSLKCGPSVLAGGSGFSSGNSSTGEEPQQERVPRRSSGNGERYPNYRDGNSRQRRSEDNLSPDFKKKLEEWDRMKCGPPAVEQGNNPLFPNKKKEAERSAKWKSDEGRDQNFQRKLLEWQCIKLTPFEFERRLNSRQERRLFPAERWMKCGGAHDSPSQKSAKRGTKELAWLEKELHKIEREKQRLERERETFLQREARLKKMRLAIGSGMRKQEVLIPTSTGTFRFQGISQKFTRKLYEWEMAQGIRPEASTFALLDPGYKLSLNASSHSPGENSSLLVRSKSVGSVADLGGPSGNDEGIAHQPSSLSLNDMDAIEGGCLHVEEDVPEALIVDLEDVSEDTGLVPDSEIIRQTPVYCYAPEEVTRLIDSSGSENEDLKKNIACKQVVESSYQLLQENMCLLNKIKQERDACLKLEHDMEHLEGQISDVSKSFDNEFEQLDNGIHGSHSVKKHMDDIRTRIDELDHQKEELQFKEDTLKERFVEHSEQEAELAQSLVGNMRELQKAHYMMTLEHGSGQHAWKEKHEKETLFSVVQELSTDLLHMAERLELNLNVRNREMWRMRQMNRDRRRTMSDEIIQRQLWTLSSYTYPKRKDYSLGRYCNEEVLQLPTLLTNKILELRKILGYYFDATESNRKQEIGLLDEDSDGSLLDNYRTIDSKDLHSNSEYTTMQDKIRDNECSSPASSFTFHPNFQQEEDVHQRKSSVWEWEKLRSEKMIIEEGQQQYEDDDSTTVSRDDEKPSTPSFSDYDYYGNSENMKREGEYKPYREIINEDSSHDEDVSEIEADCHPPPLPPVPEDFRYYPVRLDRDNSFDEKTERYAPSPESTQCEDEESSSGCRSPEDEQTDRTTSVNVFVQTTRKIFSPVYLDESGETSSVVEIVVKDPGDEKAREDEDKAGGGPAAFRERAQSASPAVLRRQSKSSFTRDSPRPGRRHFSCTKLNPSYTNNKAEDSVQKSESTASCSSSHNSTRLDKTEEEETEKETESKRVDIGFPPISPIYGRKEIRRLNKDSPAGLRMMINRFNKKTEGESLDCASSSSAGWRSPLSEWKAGENKGQSYRQEIRGVIGERTVSAIAIRTPEENGGNDAGANAGEEKGSGITKSFSVGAIRSCLDRLPSLVEFQSESVIGKESEGQSRTEEKVEEPVKTVALREIEEDGVPTPESLRLRALRLKKAKEEFLQRGLDQQKLLPPWQEDPEAAAESASIVVSEERLNELGKVLVVKSASDGNVNLVHDPRLEEAKSRSPGDDAKQKSGIGSKFKWLKIPKRNQKEEGAKRRMGTVSVLCRQSLHVDIRPSQSQSESESPVKSCPSSPALPSRSSPTSDKDQQPSPSSSSSSSSHWLKNPAKLLFRPKGKYTINNNK